VHQTTRRGENSIFAPAARRCSAEGRLGRRGMCQRCLDPAARRARETHHSVVCRSVSSAGGPRGRCSVAACMDCWSGPRRRRGRQFPLFAEGPARWRSPPQPRRRPPGQPLESAHGWLSRAAGVSGKARSITIRARGRAGAGAGTLPKCASTKSSFSHSATRCWAQGRLMGDAWRRFAKRLVAKAARTAARLGVVEPRRWLNECDDRRGVGRRMWTEPTSAP